MPDSEKDWWRARHAHRAGTHAPDAAPPHPREACEDEALVWYPQLSVCRAEMETAAAEAMFARLHEKRPWHDGTFTDWAADPSADHPYHYSYGTRIWVAGTDMGLGGNFTTRENPYAADGEDEEGGDGYQV